MKDALLFAQVELPAWWQIAQLAGAGAAFVLGIVAWNLWQAHKEDTKYIRESDKNNLKVLSELTNFIQTWKEVDVKDGQKRHEDLLRAIHDSVAAIKSHIDGHRP